MQEEIALPPPLKRGVVSLEESLWRRRSVRQFSPQPLSWEEIGQILWAGQGISEEEMGFRTAPSAGATFPLFLYALLPQGTFKYIPHSHTLRQISPKDLRSQLAVASLYQSFIAQAPLVVLISANYARTTHRYARRGIRYVDMEVGHVGQNIQLQAVALGLASVCVGAFEDEKVKALIPLPPEEEPLYIIPVGHPR